MVSGASLAQFASVTSSFMAVLDAAGVVREVNAALGQRANEANALIGKPFVALLHEDERAHVTATLGRLATGASAVFAARLTFGPSPLAVRVEATRAGDGALFVVGVPAGEGAESASASPAELEAEVVTLRKQVSTTRLLSQALKLAPMILWANDAKGFGTHLEGGGLAMVGLDKVVDPTSINIFEAYKDRPEFLDTLKRTLAGETTNRVAPFGNAMFETWYVPSRDDSGAVDGFIGLSVDVTARVKSETELRDKLEFIERQNVMIRSLATPIIQVWDGVLCLPVIGTVDSERASEMMQTLLEAIVQHEPRFAIVDLTGVDIVDTSTADLILRLFRAAKLVGTEGVLCGIRPAVAQAITSLGLDLGQVHTMRSLRYALEWCVVKLATEIGAE